MIPLLVRHNSFFFPPYAACGLINISCGAGFIANFTSCTCELTDICQIQTYIRVNGACVLVSALNNFTCNCTGTEFTGNNCEGIIIKKL